MSLRLSMLTVAVLSTLAPRAPGEARADEGEGRPVFRVACQADGRHGDDPDRVPVGRELELLRAAVEEAYPSLDANLQKVARRVAWVVEHRPSLAKAMMIGSALGDPDYRYPDTSFWPEGTIKIIVGERFIRTLDLADRLAREPGRSERVKPGLKLFVRGLFASILWETRRQREAPACWKLEECCRDGLVEPRVLEAAGRCRAYMIEGDRLAREMVLPGESDMRALGHEFREYEREHPSEFRSGGPYFLVGNVGYGSVWEYYLGLRLDWMKRKAPWDELVPPQRNSYIQGSVTRLQANLRLKGLNDAIAKAKDELRAAGRESSSELERMISEAVDKEFPAIEELQYRFIEDAPGSTLTQPVAKRWLEELKRFENLTKR